MAEEMLWKKRKQEMSVGDTGMGISVLSKMIKEDLFGKVTVDQRPESEEVSHVDKWGEEVLTRQRPLRRVHV